MLFWIGFLFAYQGDVQNGKDGHRAVKDFFESPWPAEMPIFATIDITFLDDSGQSVFSIKDYNDPPATVQYGPDPIHLVYGKDKLEPGKYTVIINIRDIEKDFSEFESHFFVLTHPKSTCGFRMLNPIGGIIKLLYWSF